MIPLSAVWSGPERNEHLGGPPLLFAKTEGDVGHTLVVGSGTLSNDAIEPVALQPLAAISDPAEQAWAAEWVAAILAREGVRVTPEAKDHLWSALTSLVSATDG
jgi:type IV secretory pathway VirB4 component